MQTSRDILIAERYLLHGPPSVVGEVETFAAHDLLLDRPVTVQWLTPEGAADADLSRLFLRHQQLASAVQNCPILTVYDAGLSDGRPFSVRERDKGQPARRLGKPGGAPDVARALKIVAQAAGTLACLREAGLTDWVFAPGALEIDEQGVAYIAVIEGLSGFGSSRSPQGDGDALRALLNLLLTGNPKPDENEYRAAYVPVVVSGALGAWGSLPTARQFEERVREIERRATGDTQAYVPQEGGTPGKPDQSGVARWDAPTLPAYALPVREEGPGTASVATINRDGQPYVPVAGEKPANAAGRDLRPLAVIAAAFLLGLLLLLGASKLRGVNNVTARTSPTPVSQPASVVRTPEPPALVAAPDLGGKTLDEAETLARENGLTIRSTTEEFNADTQAGRVSQQKPPPGTQLEAGSGLDLVISAGPQPLATIAVKPPVQNEPPAKGDDEKPPKKSEDKKEHDKKGGEK